MIDYGKNYPLGSIKKLNLSNDCYIPRFDKIDALIGLSNQNLSF